MSPENRARLLELVQLYVEQGKLAWGADGLYAYDPQGAAPWYVLEALKVWNGLLWWPNELLSELLDLLEAKTFSVGLSSTPTWMYESFKELQTQLSRHIEARNVYVTADRFKHAASYQANPSWEHPLDEDLVTLIKKRIM